MMTRSRAEELDGQLVEGSPVIAVKAAKEFLQNAPGRRMSVFLFETNDNHRASLKRELGKLQPFGDRLSVTVLPSDAKEAVPLEVSKLAFIPTFFMIDPYGHPLTVSIINGILMREKTEALINFMYYRINMDSENPKVRHNLDVMFGSSAWQSQSFLKLSGIPRERGFLDYFCSTINAASYHFPFRIKFDREDYQSSDRTKYYLVHVSKHPKAVLLMKEVMWPLGDEAGTFEFGQRQSSLFSSTPSTEQLKNSLLDRYHGRIIGFDEIREDTWDLPFIEKHHRSAIKDLKELRRVSVTPVTSKTERGLKGSDRVRFLRKPPLRNTYSTFGLEAFVFQSTSGSTYSAISNPRGCSLAIFRTRVSASDQ